MKEKDALVNFENQLTHYQRFAHKLRNPVNTISMNAELAKMLLGNPENSEKVESVLDEIVIQCERCAEIIAELAEE